MNKSLLLCLLMALFGQSYAQKATLKSYREAQASESSLQVNPAPQLIKPEPALQEGMSDAPLYTSGQSISEFPEYWPDRLFVKLKTGQNDKIKTFTNKANRPKVASTDKLNRALLRHEAASVAELPRLQKALSSRNAYQVVLDKKEELQSLMQELKALPEVEYVERVPYYVAFQSPNDPEYLNNNQYALHRTKAAEAFGVHTGKAKTLLAIVDDAVLVSHPDLAANVNIAKSYDVADKDSNPNPPSSGPNKAGISNFSHGTHCAGIAGAVTNNGVGIAAISNNNVSIIGVKCTRDLAPTSRAIEYAAEGIIYAINQGARVISMSFGGGGYSQTMQNIINEATANGVVFVAAAGNDNTENKMYPAAYNNVIAVASTDANDLKSGFSNYGSWIDISAPGSGILSTVTAADGVSGAYTYYSGTSMACPMVASQIALMLSQNPELTPQAVLQILKATADPIDDIPNQPASLAGKLGGGRINAFRAIQAIKGITNTEAPAAITNLSVIRSAQTELEIQWTAPDAGGSAAALYDIRYSTAPITAANFEAAAKSKQNVFPDQPGHTQTLTIRELNPGTAYYVAIVAKSLYGSASPLSNVATGTTLPAPIVKVNPAGYALSIDRTSSTTSSRSFTLTNEGSAQLNYNAAVVPVAGSNIAAYDKPQLSADNAVGLGGGSFITAAKFTAGAIGFNLSHVQNFLNSSTTTGNLSIGVRILKGGINPANATLLYSQNFSTSVPAGGRLFTFPLQTPQRLAAGEVFWIVFVLPNGLDYPQGFDMVGSMPGTFYLSTNNGSSYEDAQTLASFLANAAFKIRAANADWVTLAPVAGSIQPGQAADVNMAFNVTNVPDGVYQMNASFTSNDPLNPVINRPVTLTVTGGQAKFAMETKEINFGTLFTGSSRTVKFIFTNTGTATLTVKAETVNVSPFSPADFAVDRQSTITLAPGTQREIPITFTPTQRGDLNGTLTLSTNDPAAGTVTVPVVAKVISAPTAKVTPTTLNYEMNFGGETTATQKVAIQNTGEAELTYSLQALVDPLATISYSANRNADSFLGYGSQYPYIYTAMRFDVSTANFNLTHVQNFFRTEVAANKTINMKVYKGGNSPTSGTLLVNQNFESAAASGASVTIPLQQPQQFKQGEVFWVIFYYSGINQPQGYHTNTPNPGRNFYSSNGSGWSTLESVGGVLGSSSYVIRALDMPQWLSVTPANGVIAAGNTLENAITVNAAGLQKGRYKGKVQVLTNDPNQPEAIVEVNLQLEDSPVADFKASLTEVIPGEAVAFENASKNADAYEWEFEGAEPATSTTASPTVTYSTPGKYKVTLKAKNTLTGRTTEALVKEQYITVQNTLCHDLNAPFAGTEALATTEEGYITGNNKQGDKAKVNYFNYNRPNAYITGLKVKFGAAAAAGADAKVTVAVWNVDAGNGKPQHVIASKEVKIADIAADVTAGRLTNVVFDAPVGLTGSFFAGVVLNNEAGNAVAVVHNTNENTTPGTAWTQDSQNNWKAFGTEWPELTNVALYIQPAVTQTLTPVVADFTMSAALVCVGQELQLDATSTVGAVRYEWIFAGAATTASTEVKPKVTYATAGTYMITLKAFDECSGVVVITKEVTIQALPDATVTASGSTTLCEGEKVTLSAVAGEGMTYRWSNGATTRTIEVSAAGNYSVTITNASGCTAISEAVAIKVNPLPVAGITASGATTFCEGEKVALSAPTGEGYAYLWSNGATTRSIEVSTAGSYTVTVTNANGCAATSEATAVVVNPLPVATITVTGSTTLCEGERVTLVAPEGNGYQYRWSNGATTRSITVDNAGSYQVTITNTNGCAATSEAVVVRVNPLPVASVAANGSTILCQGERVTLAAAAGEGYSYRWSNGATTRTIEVGTSGKYSVTVTNATDCAAVSNTIEVKVNALPVAKITASSATTFCQGGSVVLTASEGSSYRWSNGATTRSITVSVSGSYTVSITNANGCAATSEVVRTVMNPLPAKPQVYRNDIVLTSSSATGNQWFRNNTAIAGATGASYEATQPGQYHVQVTNTNGCVSEKSEEVKVTGAELITNLQVYPNPGNGRLNITFTGLRPDKVSIRILNMTGQVIYQGNKDMLESRDFQIDISSAASGVYLLQLQHNGTNYSRKVIIRH